MRTIRAAVLGLGLILAPVAASAQTGAQTGAQTPAPAAAGGWSTATTLAVGTGAVLGVVAINAATGGALLVPLAGPAVSNALGGNLLGAAALSPAARQALCRTVTLLATATAGAALGYWIVSE
ncbi:hypothetical protein [Thalassobaculum sp.]|uniref:hypothetical protein n=1 Tax=Thalassobaculum sp. TaxID=2022740 RepID=UPI0032EB23C2